MPALLPKYSFTVQDIDDPDALPSVMELESQRTALMKQLADAPTSAIGSMQEQLNLLARQILAARLRDEHQERVSLRSA